MHGTQPSEPKPVRILVVEDDNIQQMVLASALTQSGYEVETASDGLEAVWKVRSGGYDVVLVDYYIPEIDGLATARLIRDLVGDTARPVLIALTAASSQLAGRETGSNDAFDEVIAKPVGLEVLVGHFERHLASAPDREARQAAQAALLLDNWAEYDGEPARPDAGEPVLPRILVVEDDAVQQLVLQSARETRGYVVETASDGLEAVRKIRDGVFDLVLVDYQLPEIDGLATAKLSLDLMGEDVRPRLIALTSVPGDLTERQAATGSAFDEIVAKSPDLPALLATVHRHLQAAPRSATRRAAELIPQDHGDPHRAVA